MKFELGELWRALRATLSRQRDAVFSIMGPIKSEEALRASETALNTQKQNVKLLRNVADNVDIVRAAIDAKKLHVQALKIKVSGPDKERAEELEALLRWPGPGMTWRKWLSEFLEDLLVLDMATVYVWPRRNGELFG